MKKYGAFNPMNGKYSIEYSQSKLYNKLSDIMIEFYIKNSHKQLFVEIEVIENTDEIWTSISHDETKEEIKKEIKNLIINKLKDKNYEHNSI